MSKSHTEVASHAIAQAFVSERRAAGNAWAGPAEATTTGKI